MTRQTRNQSTKLFNYSIKSLLLATLIVAAFFGGRASMRNEIDRFKSIMNAHQAEIVSLQADKTQLISDIARTREQVVEKTNELFKLQSSVDR